MEQSRDPCVHKFERLDRFQRNLKYTFSISRRMYRFIMDIITFLKPETYNTITASKVRSAGFRGDRYRLL